MTRCRFIDVDGTIFKPGTQEWLPGALEKLKEWSDAGDMLVLFTMRPMGPWMKVLPMNRINVAGYIQKPCAHEFYVYDDHLVEGRQSLCCPHKNIWHIPPLEAAERKAPTWTYCRDCDIYLYADEWERTTRG